ncbi:MAG: DUF1080 domain-containing protein [Chthoniobacteraceae bacterium]
MLRATALVLALVFAAHAADKDELPPADPAANKLSAEEIAQGWKLLFDGRGLPGLRNVKGTDPLRVGWKLERNQLVLPKDIKNSGKVTGGDLVATVAYDNFEFRFDFRVAASADSGVLYFARGGVGQKLIGHEYQIIDDVHHPDGLKGGDLKRTGALYGVLPRLQGPSIRISQRWNEEEWNYGILVVQGTHVEHWLNGQKALEYDLGADFQSRVAAQRIKAPLGFGTKLKSPVVILDQGEEVAFCNLKIRPLPPRPILAGP